MLIGYIIFWEMVVAKFALLVIAQRLDQFSLSLEFPNSQNGTVVVVAELIILSA